MTPFSEGLVNKIKEYLTQFLEKIARQPLAPVADSPSIQEYLQNRSTKPNLKPFHHALMPHNLLLFSQLERQISTRLGSTFEQCALLIAREKHRKAERNCRTEAEVSVGSLAEIEKQVRRLENQVPSLSEMIEAVLSHRASKNVTKVQVVSDLYIETHQGHELFFELKSPVPNKGQCLEVAQRILRIHLVKGKARPEMQAYFAMAYNPYGGGRENYRWNYARRYLPFDETVLIADEFWDMIGGQNTYETLLQIYHEVGRDYTERFRSLLQQE